MQFDTSIIFCAKKLGDKILTSSLVNSSDDHKQVKEIPLVAVSLELSSAVYNDTGAHKVSGDILVIEDTWHLLEECHSLLCRIA